jgi:peptidoglycan/LPS O-acetylase OafA/YrhL
MASQPRIPFTKTTASVLLDGTRAAAALLVCLSHWRMIFFVSYPLLHVPHKFLYIPFYAITGAGHASVIVFFVLSGYLISGSVFRMFDNGSWSWRRYLTHRLVRLWIVLIPALILGGVLDSAGLRLNHAPGLYTGLVDNNMALTVPQFLTVRSFFGNLIFVQWILTPTFGSNGPLWSLANEFWYYILFPLGVIAFRHSFPPLHRLLSAVLFIGISFFVGHSILFLFPVWLLGAVLARMPQRLPTRARTWVWILYPVLFFLLVRPSFIPSLAKDYLLGIFTFFLVLSMLSATGLAPARVWVGVCRIGSRFSYTLYLVHVPFLVFLASLIVDDSRWSMNLKSALGGMAVIVAAYIYAYSVAFVTEFRTDTVRGQIERIVLPRSNKSVLAAAASSPTSAGSGPA